MVLRTKVCRIEVSGSWFCEPRFSELKLADRDFGEREV